MLPLRAMHVTKDCVLPPGPGHSHVHEDCVLPSDSLPVHVSEEVATLVVPCMDLRTVCCPAKWFVAPIIVFYSVCFLNVGCM